MWKGAIIWQGWPPQRAGQAPRFRVVEAERGDGHHLAVGADQYVDDDAVVDPVFAGQLGQLAIQGLGTLYRVGRLVGLVQRRVAVTHHALLRRYWSTWRTCMKTT